MSGYMDKLFSYKRDLKYRYLSVCLSVYLSFRLSVWMSLFLSFCLSVSFYLSVCLSVCLTVCPSVCLSFRPSFRPSFRLSVCPSVRIYGQTILLQKRSKMQVAIMQVSKGIRLWPINWCTIIPNDDTQNYPFCIKISGWNLSKTQLNETTNQNSLKFLKLLSE